MSLTKDRQQLAYEALRERYHYTSPMQAPRVTRVVVSSGVGKKRQDPKMIELIEDRLPEITRQKSARPAAPPPLPPL